MVNRTRGSHDRENEANRSIKLHGILGHSAYLSFLERGGYFRPLSKWYLKATACWNGSLYEMLSKSSGHL